MVTTKKKKESSRTPKNDDDELDEPFAEAHLKDLLDQVKRGKQAAPRLKRQKEKLAKLIDADPRAEAETRTKEYQACLDAATKRVQKLQAEHDKRTKKQPSLMQQIENMLSREHS